MFQTSALIHVDVFPLSFLLLQPWVELIAQMCVFILFLFDNVKLAYLWIAFLFLWLWTWSPLRVRTQFMWKENEVTAVGYSQTSLDSWFMVTFLRISVVYFLSVPLVVCSPQCEMYFLFPEHVHVHLLVMSCSSGFYCCASCCCDLCSPHLLVYQSLLTFFLCRCPQMYHKNKKKSGTVVLLPLGNQKSLYRFVLSIFWLIVTCLICAKKLIKKLIKCVLSLCRFIVVVFKKKTKLYLKCDQDILNV